MSEPLAWRGLLVGFGLGVVCVYVIPATMFTILYSIPLSDATSAVLDVGALVVGVAVGAGPLMYLLFKRRWPIATGYAGAILTVITAQFLAIA